MTDDLRVEAGGEGDSLLVFLHGMGATGEVWRGMTDLAAGRWPGRWMVPDLPGHGGSAPLDRYSFGHLAAAVARAVPPADRVVVLGHSLGGVVALALASGWFGVTVARAIGLGIKVHWTDEELARARSLAARAHQVYATRAEAAERHLRIAGLTGLVDPDAVPEAALRRTGDGWTLSFDQRAFAMGAPDLPGLLTAARARVTLAAGERDPMSTRADLERLAIEPVMLPGLAHNAQVEDPDAVWRLIES